MSYRTKLLGLGLEDDQSLAGGEEQTVDTGAQELLEVNEVAAEIDQTHEAVAEAQESSEQLEEVATALESMIEAGRGLSADAARFAHQSVSFATRKFGIVTPMPAMESFSTGASGQFGQTKASLEGIKETIQKIWTWIKEQFAKLRGHMKDFWLKTFDGAARLKKRADAMAKKADGITKAATGDKANVTVSGDLVTKLSVNKALNIDAGMASLKAAAEAILQKQTDVQVKMAQDATDDIKSADFADKAKLEKAIDDLIVSSAPKIDSIFTVPVTDKPSHSGFKSEGLTVKATAELPGGQHVYMAFSEKPGADRLESLKKISKTRGGMESVRDKDPEGKEKKESTLPASKIVSICEDVSAIATLIEGFRRNFQNQEKAKEAFTAAGKHVETEAPKAEGLDADGQKLAAALARCILVIPTLIDQPAQQFAKYAVSTLNATLNYAQLSLSQYN